MTNELQCELAGRFRMQVLRPDGTTRLDTGWFNNLILDAGLNRLGVNQADGRCRVGTGATAPAVGQTALVNQVAFTTAKQETVNGYDESGNLYGYTRSRYRFEAGVAAGVLAEVGIGWADSGATLFSRALILDDEGNPTTITVLGDEVLDVTYELRLYRPVNDLTYGVTISGVAYTFTRRAMNMSAWGQCAQYLLLSGAYRYNAQVGNNLVQVNAYGPGALGPVTGQPSGAYRGGASQQDQGAAYVNNSYEADYKSTFSLGSVTQNIGNLTFGSNCGYYQVNVDPPMAKTASNILVLNWKHSWARKVI